MFIWIKDTDASIQITKLINQKVEKEAFSHDLYRKALLDYQQQASLPLLSFSSEGSRLILYTHNLIGRRVHHQDIARHGKSVSIARSLIASKSVIRCSMCIYVLATQLCCWMCLLLEFGFLQDRTFHMIDLLSVMWLPTASLDTITS